MFETTDDLYLHMLIVTKNIPRRLMGIYSHNSPYVTCTRCLELLRLLGQALFRVEKLRYNDLMTLAVKSCSSCINPAHLS